jgi:hypothetical protein
MTVNGIQKTAPLGEAVVIDASGQGEIPDLETPLSRVRTESERAMIRTELTASCKLIGNLGNTNVGGEALS